MATARCNYLEDITFMRRTSEAPRMLMMCMKDAAYVAPNVGFYTVQRCQFHYEMMVYRGEDVSQYRPVGDAVAITLPTPQKLRQKPSQESGE
jgi:hypothetical protein